MSSSSNGHKMYSERYAPTDEEVRLAIMAISEVKTKREHTADEYRVYECKHTGDLLMMPIYYGKPLRPNSQEERGG